MNNYKLSIYTSLYNIGNGIYDWQKSLVNFMDFADQVVVATTTDCKDNTVKTLEEYCSKYEKLKLIITNISFDDYAFDGKLKNAALQETDFEGKILLDIDEWVPTSQRPIWLELTRRLYDDKNYLIHAIDGFLIPSVNLCQSIYTAKDIGYKFYLHKKGLYRGIVNFAKLPNGKIDTSKSDSCELIDQYGDLAKCLRIDNSLENIKKYNLPYIFHDFAIHPQDRLKKNKFWKPVWENRAGEEANDIIKEIEEIEKIKVFEHGLNL